MNITTTTKKQNEVLLRGCEQSPSNFGEAWQHLGKMLETIKHVLAFFLFAVSFFAKSESVFHIHV